MALPFPSLSPWLWRNPNLQHPPPILDTFPSPSPSPSPPPSHDLDPPASFQPSRNPLKKKSTSGTADRRPFQLRRPPGGRSSSSSGGTRRRRGGPKRPFRDTQSVDVDLDLVLVPSDAGYCVSASDSEDSDWSIGWFEPHAPDFCSDDEPERSFAVLVPCYGSPSMDHRRESGRLGGGWPEQGSKSQLWAAVLASIAQDSRAETNFYLQQWLSSLQG